MRIFVIIILVFVAFISVDAQKKIAYVSDPMVLALANDPIRTELAKYYSIVDVDATIIGTKALCEASNISMVVITNAPNSGSAGFPELEGVNKPVLCMKQHILRLTLWNWLPGTNNTYFGDRGNKQITLNPAEASHAIFSGLSSPVTMNDSSGTPYKVVGYVNTSSLIITGGPVRNLATPKDSTIQQTIFEIPAGSIMNGTLLNNKFLFIGIQVETLIKISADGLKLVKNACDYLTAGSPPTLSSEKNITSFSIAGINGTINGTAISLTLPAGSSLTNQVATFTLSAAATAKVGTTIQVSGISANDFTAQLIYTINAEDGSTQYYYVTVTKSLNTAKSITSFRFNSLNVTGTINALSNTISLTVPGGTDITRLIATFTLSPYATAKVGTTFQQSGTTMNNFTNPVTYIVTAENGSTQTWTVNVAYKKQFAISKIIIPISGGVINGIPTIPVDTGTAISFCAQPAKGFYFKKWTISTGTAIDSTTYNHQKDSCITFSVHNNVTFCARFVCNEANILTFSFDSIVTSSFINTSAKTVEVTVPKGTNLTSLVGSFTLSYGAIAKINGILQTSNKSPNDFTNPITYTVTPEDGSINKEWKVNVFVEREETTALEKNKEPYLKIYPTIVKYVFRIESANNIEHIVITDMQGRVIMNNRYRSKQVELGTSTWKNGIYMVKLQTTNGQRMQMIQVAK